MVKRDDAARKLLLWELEGRGGLVMEAMLRHPDLNLAEAVDLIEQENPNLSSQGASPEEGPMAESPKPRPTSELEALEQEFKTFRHLLPPAEAKEMEARLREIARSRDRAAIVAMRRRLRALSLQAAFWSEFASPRRESNAMALVILSRGGDVLAKSGETSYLEQDSVVASIRRESGRQSQGTYVMHLPVGRLVLMNGKSTSIAALFRRAPGKDVVSVLTKTVEAIEENRAVASRTFGDNRLGAKYAEALLKLLQKTSL